MKTPSYLWLSLIALAPALCHAQLTYTGVNLSGAEFGNTPTPSNRGTYNTDYTYPTSAEVDYFIAKGMNTFRLPFRWERLQPTARGAFDSAEFTRFNNFISYATSHGANVIIDPHNFQRYYPDPSNFESSTQGLVGSAVPNSTFNDFWSRIATQYKNNSRVIFGLMNEPNTMPTEQLVTSENAAIAAIRATGATNLVLVPGNAWTGAWTWNQNWYGTPNATAMLNITDSGSNFAFEVHQYMNADGSGGSSDIANNDPQTGVQRLTSFTQWLQANHRRGFLGEFAVANSTIGTSGAQIGDETITNMLNYMQSNSSVWLGWTWWAAGPWWGEYQFTLEPTNLGQSGQTDRAAMGVLSPFATPVPVIWLGAGSSGSWSTAANWNRVPSNGANLTFAGTTKTSTTNNSLTSVGSITFDAGAGAFTLLGNALSISGGITNNSANNQTITLNLTLSAPQQFNAASGTFKIDSNIATAGNTLTIAGASNTALSGQISGNGGLSKSGTGTLSLVGSNTYTGGTAANAGMILVSKATALGTGPLSITSTAIVKLQAGLTSPIQLTGLIVSGGSVTVADDARQGPSAEIATAELGAATVLSVPEPAALLLGALAAGIAICSQRRLLRVKRISVRKS